MAVLFVAAIVAGVAGAATWTDKPDYSPGSTVTISGDNSNLVGYLAGETVHVDVSGPYGWTATCDGVADDAGAWSCQVTLADTDEAVGDYSYTATGLDSGVTENGTFTDMSSFNVRAMVGSTAIAVTFPGTVSAGAFHRYASSTNCTGSFSYRTTNLTTLTTGAFSNVTGGIATINGQSISATAPATVTVGSTTYAFFNWTVVNSSGGTTGLNGSVTNSGQTGCFSGWNDTIPTYAQANYVLAAPVADAGGPYTTAEGTGVQLDASGSTGTGTLHYEWSVDTTGIDSGGTCTFDDNTLQKPTITCTDDSDDAIGDHFVVSVKVTDDNGNNTDSANLTVSNADPVADTPTNTSQSNCSVSISASFTDAGTNDTHTATIDWGDGNNAATGSVTETDGSGSVTGSHTYAAPGSYNVTVTVTDDDSGSDTSSALVVDNTPSLTYPLPPIVDYNKYKIGSAIPVKIIVVGCTAGLAPTITVQADGAVSPAPPNAKGKSSKTVGAMRYDSHLPGFIYNWDTKGLTKGFYTIWISGLPTSLSPTLNYAYVELVKG